jgi:hypothetical protein
MDIRRRVNKLYHNLMLSKVKTEFIIFDKDKEPPKIKADTIQIVLAI